MQTKKFRCKNFKKDYTICELCVANKTYIDIQNTECQSCFKPDLNSVKQA